ncbi:hypothetical protein [Rhizobium binxianense]|uniref:hypothetical protein n=1 Tax=Rhizobium binxianense TaxID=3024242 RepID=UPI00234ECCB8|nr:hypothetical protein [Rhizobium sp. BC56]MDC7745814.1 hypothetical protein [Rhizobium sp. BC56]
MKFLVTACLLSERLKPHPKPGVQEFFERSEIAVPFATYLTIERGLEILARRDPCKEALLRHQVGALLEGCQVLESDNASVALALARILGYGPLRHTWLPSEKAKEPSYGHYPWVAAASLVTGIPIATVKTKDLLAVSSYFELSGIYDPVHGVWMRGRIPTGSPRNETLSANSVSSPQ